MNRNDHVLYPSHPPEFPPGSGGFGASEVTVRRIFQYPEGGFLVATVKRQLKKSERLSRTWFRYNHIEYSEMFLGPFFPRFGRYVPEENLSI